MKSGKLIAGLFLGGGLCLASIAQAVPSASFDLVQTNQTLGSITFDVKVTYDDQPAGSGLAFIQLDVAASSAALSAGGTDYSRFAFTPGAELTGWTSFLLDTPGFGVGDSLVAYEILPPDSATGALLDGIHTLGVLSVDLTGLPFGGLLIALSPPNALGGTDAGQEDVPGVGPFVLLSQVDGGIDVSDSPVSFQIVDPNPQPPTNGGIPEPATAILGLVAAGALSMRRFRA